MEKDEPQDIRTEICNGCNAEVACAVMDVYALQGETVGELLCSPVYLCKTCLQNALDVESLFPKLKQYIKTQE